MTFLNLVSVIILLCEIATLNEGLKYICPISPTLKKVSSVQSVKYKVYATEGNIHQTLILRRCIFDLERLNVELKVNKMFLQNGCNHLNEYSKYSTIHGIIFIGERFLTTITRLVWLLVLLTCLTICLYQSARSTQEYLQFNVETSITFQPIDKLDFPSITFYSPHQFKRSEVGNYSLAPMFLSYTLTSNNELDKKLDFSKIIAQNCKTCQSNHRTNFIEELERVGEKGFLNDSASFLKGMRLIMRSYKNDFVKCWWRNEERSCDEMFIDSFIKGHMCNIFNSGNEFSKFLHSFDGNIQQKSNEFEFGMKNWTMNSVGFLVNINQSEYCGTGLFRNGAGLEVTVSEKDALSILNVNSPLKLSAGYIHNIILKTTLYERHTKNLGYCTDDVDLFIFPTGKKYLQSVCFAQCFLVAVFRECNCYPAHLRYMQTYFQNLTDKLNIPLISIKPCDDEFSGPCFNNVVDRLTFNYPLIKMCPVCNRQCYETLFTFRSTKTLLQTDALRKDMPKYENATEFNETFLRKNFVYVSFSFEDNYVEVVIEKQEISLKDLFIDYGNNIGLFLGMSFMSTFEIIIEIFLKSFIASIHRLRCQVRKVKLLKRKIKKRNVIITSL